MPLSINLGVFFILFSLVLKFMPSYFYYRRMLHALLFDCLVFSECTSLAIVLAHPYALCMLTTKKESSLAVTHLFIG